MSLLVGAEEVNDIILCQHRTTEDAKDFIDASIQVKRVLNNGSKAVGGNGLMKLKENGECCINKNIADRNVRSHSEDRKKT